RHARADLALQRLAPRRGVLDARDLDRLDLLADRGDGQRELVHDEAGIHARAEERDVVRARDLLQLFAQRGVEREGELLARGDDVAAALEQRAKLRRDGAQARPGGVAEDLRLSLPGGC